MEKRWLNSMLSNGELEYWCRLSKSINSLGPIESEGSARNNMNKNIPSHSDSYNSSYSTVDDLVGIRNFVSDDTFFVRDSNSSSYSIYLDIENQIFEIDNDPSFVSELESSFYSFRNSTYQNDESKSDDSHYDRYMYDTKYSWNNHINSCIDSYLRAQICIDSYILSGSHNYSDSYIYSYICGEGGNSSESESSSIRTSTDGSDLTRTESSNDLDVTQKYRHLWVQCENCYGLNYKKFLKSKMNICEQCGYHLKMSSSDRIELLIDPGTWDPMDEDMVSLDPIEFHSEEEPYKDRIYYYQSNQKLFYVAILTSPTTGGVTASFGMLGDIIIAEPNAYIAFAGKRVIEQTLNKTVPEGSQAAEYLFQKGLFDLIVPRNPLKGVVSELFQLHAFVPSNKNSIK